MYDVLLIDADGKEIWIDYSWLYQGCINDLYFNWMYGLWTVQNPDIKSMLSEGTPYRKFISEFDDKGCLKKFGLEKI